VAQHHLANINIHVVILIFKLFSGAFNSYFTVQVVSHCHDSHTQLTATIPQILRIVIAGVDSHTIRIDSRQKSFVVINEILGTSVSHAKCGRLTEWTDIVALTCTTDMQLISASAPACRWSTQPSLIYNSQPAAVLVR